jgi:hypothetical protein
MSTKENEKQQKEAKTHVHKDLGDGAIKSLSEEEVENDCHTISLGTEENLAEKERKRKNNKK